MRRSALAVGLALFAVRSMATGVAISLPYLLSRLGRDPAFGSGPLATVVQDLLSLVMYFVIVAAIGRAAAQAAVTPCVRARGAGPRRQRGDTSRGGFRPKVAAGGRCQSCGTKSVTVRPTTSHAAARTPCVSSGRTIAATPSVAVAFPTTDPISAASASSETSWRRAAHKRANSSADVASATNVRPTPLSSVPSVLVTSIAHPPRTCRRPPRGPARRTRAAPAPAG